VALVTRTGSLAGWLAGWRVGGSVGGHPSAVCCKMDLALFMAAFCFASRFYCSVLFVDAARLKACKCLSL